MHFHCAKSLYDNTCVRLKVLYMKHYNNRQPNLIMHYLSHSIPHSIPLSPLPHTNTHTSLLPLSPPPTPPLTDHWSASEDIKNQQQQNPKQKSHCFLGISTVCHKEGKCRVSAHLIRDMRPPPDSHHNVLCFQYVLQDMTVH